MEVTEIILNSLGAVGFGYAIYYLRSKYQSKAIELP